MGRPKKVVTAEAEPTSVEALGKLTESTENLEASLEQPEVAIQTYSTAEPLITDNFVRNEDGSVNWRKMIKPEFLVLNGQYKEQIEKVYNKPMGELSVADVEDKYLLILLGGIKELADLRGYSRVRYPNVVAQPGYVSVYCEIDWLPFESSGAKTYGDGADATPENTDRFATKYLTAIAYNRAFVRAVRNFLKIHIVGKDEVSSAAKVDMSGVSDDNQLSPMDPRSAVKDALDKAGKSFEEFQQRWAKINENPEALNWKSIVDMSKSEAILVLQHLAKKKAS